jgi:hypothetical protein
METIPKTEAQPKPTTPERLAYSVQESVDMLGVNYFSVNRLIQRGKLNPCRGIARQAACAAHRTVEAVGNRMRHL